MGIKLENWVLDQSGLYMSSPSLEFFQTRFLAITSTRQAGNMQDEQSRVNFLRRLDLDHGKLAVSYQIHGTEVHLIKSVQDCPTSRVDGVDGWIAYNVEGLTLGTFSADCLSVFILHREKNLGLLLHAGWRGLRQGIIKTALKQCFANVSHDFYPKAGDFLAAIGPHVRSCCYEVGEDVAKKFPKEFIEARGGKTHLNLETAAAGLLVELGIEDVFISQDCTRCRQDLFFSYRRKDKGSMMSILNFS